MLFPKNEAQDEDVFFIEKNNTKKQTTKVANNKIRCYTLKK
jgi:hypothetical protein